MLTNSTFQDALAQAQGEVLTVFNIEAADLPGATIPDFDTLDITGTGAGNASCWPSRRS